jgi:hypothetical protein
MTTKFLTVLFCILSFNVHAGVSITTINHSEKELKIKRNLVLLLEKYDLSSWIYTTAVEVDENAIVPYSHPVLTMSTQKAYLDNPIKLLSTFLHEQFHWHVIKNGKSSKEDFRKEIKTAFPDVKVERPLGSGTEGSTLSHLIVCYLEYTALAALVGEEKAIETLSTNDYYTWIYQTVLKPENSIELDKLVHKFGLDF